MPALHPGLLAVCDVVVPNETEAEALGGADALLRAGAAAVVVTLVERGALVLTEESTDVVEPHRVVPVDTVGAGDAFVGALCADLARGTPLIDACRTGAVAGALATTVRGAVQSIPTRAAVLAAQ